MVHIIKVGVKGVALMGAAIVGTTTFLLFLVAAVGPCALVVGFFGCRWSRMWACGHVGYSIYVAILWIDLRSLGWLPSVREGGRVRGVCVCAELGCVCVHERCARSVQ